MVLLFSCQFCLLNCPFPFIPLRSFLVRPFSFRPGKSRVPVRCSQFHSLTSFWAWISLSVYLWFIHFWLVVSPGPPPFNAEYGAPPQYTPDYQRQGYIQQPGHYGGAGSTSTNVVVVTQPVRPVVPISRVSYAPDYLGLSVFMIICCTLMGTWLALICVIPALIFSILAHDHNRTGRTDEASRLGRLALGLNIGGLVSGIFVCVGVGIFIAVNFTVLEEESTYNY